MQDCPLEPQTAKAEDRRERTVTRLTLGPPESSPGEIPNMVKKILEFTADL